jgi:hypothetical protein
MNRVQWWRESHHAYMASTFEHQETTWVYDHTAGTAELYTTSRRLWLRAIARSPRYLQAQALEPGYRILYDLDAVKVPELLVAPKPGGDAAVESFLTDAERASRAAAAQRLKAARHS